MGKGSALGQGGCRSGASGHGESQLAHRELRASNAAISTIAFDAGFNDLSTFNRRFRREMGEAPGAYRARRVGR